MNLKINCGTFRLTARRAFAKKLRIPRRGQRFGKLIVTDNTPRSVSGHRCVACACDCGTKNFVVRVERLVSGNSTTCGCGRWPAKTGHAAKDSPTYRSWNHMGMRVKSHKDYRNVRITPRWLGPRGFESFLADMGPRPKGTTLGRILDGKLYAKGACEWQTLEIQGLHRRCRTGLRRFAAVYGHRPVKLK